MSLTPLSALGSLDPASNEPTRWESPLIFAPALIPQEDLVVVVNPASGVTHLTRDEVVNIFMGRQRRLPSGLIALPVEPVADPELRARFYESLVKVSLVQVRSYWARLFFSGQAQPPWQAQTPEEVLQVVLANKGAIGFVPRKALNSKVHPVLVLRGEDHP
jgi:ABC-type phosphate transport system substrate-binding protein